MQLETPKLITLEEFKEALGSVILEAPILEPMDADSPSSVKSSQSVYRDAPKVILSNPTKKKPKMEERAPRKKGPKPKVVKRLLQESPTKKTTLNVVKKLTPKAGTSGATTKSIKKTSPYTPIIHNYIKIYGTNYKKCGCYLVVGDKIIRDDRAAYGYHKKCKGYFEWNTSFEVNFPHDVLGVSDFLLLSAKDIRVDKSTFQK